MRKGLLKGGIAAALDIGSSKVCCFIARVDDDGTPRVIGIGQQASRGIKGGTIIDMDLAETSVLNAVHAAEQMAGETIDRVIVNLSGGYPASTTVGVVTRHCTKVFLAYAFVPRGGMTVPCALSTTRS